MRPVEGMLQTTVIDPSATDSDALSTVVFVLGPEASRKLLALQAHHTSPHLQPTTIRPILYRNKLDRQPLRGIPHRRKKDPIFMIDRRLFVRGLSAAVATHPLSSRNPHSPSNQTPTPKRHGRSPAPRTTHPFDIGIIGPGSRGNELVRSFLRVPGVKIVAAADVYQPRFAQLNEACGYQVASHADYRALLDRKDLDAVVVATPLGLHAQHVLPALEAGHHVYGEKTMAYTIEDAAKIVNATAAHKRIFQVGHQYRYSPWIRAAVARVQQGEIGDVTHILAYWNRNNNWRRPVPDPSLERLINWRLYNQWSLGLLAELGSHHMDIANWVFGSTPTAALASGSIC